jgi:hypothetical protein
MVARQGDQQTNKQTGAFEILVDKQLGKGSPGTYPSITFFNPGHGYQTLIYRYCKRHLHVCILIRESSEVHTRRNAYT